MYGIFGSHGVRVIVSVSMVFVSVTRDTSKLTDSVLATVLSSEIILRPVEGAKEYCTLSSGSRFLDSRCLDTARSCISASSVLLSCSDDVLPLPLPRLRSLRRAGESSPNFHMDWCLCQREKSVCHQCFLACHKSKTVRNWRAVWPFSNVFCRFVDASQRLFSSGRLWGGSMPYSRYCSSVSSTRSEVSEVTIP